MKYTTCYECNERMDVGDVAFEFAGDLFCSADCVTTYVEWHTTEGEVTECHCTEEDEDYRDDQDE